MATITISLPDDRHERLKERAARLGVAPEELLRAGIAELLSLPNEDFLQAMNFVMQKNADLYRRLA